MGTIHAIFGFITAIFGAIDVEQAHYTVTKQTQHYEVRTYAPVMGIQTDMKDDRSGFRNLAGYIGVMGEPMNTAHQQIAMTAPVVKEENKMMFWLPQKMNQDNTPEPIGNNVQVKKFDERTMVVQTFSGRIDMQGAEAKVRNLAELAKGENIDANHWELMQYNPPWCLPWFRKNEI